MKGVIHPHWSPPFANPEARSLALGFYHKLSSLYASRARTTSVYETVRRYVGMTAARFGIGCCNLPHDEAIQGR